MPDVFISYNADDRERADRIRRELTRKRLDVFFDQSALTAGQSWSSRITEAVRNAKVLVVLLSANTARSPVVEREVAAALEDSEGKTVIPVLLDAEAKQNWVWPLVANRQAIDLTSADDKQVIEAVMQAFPRRRAFGPGFWVKVAAPLIVVIGLILFALQTPRALPNETEAARVEIPDLLGKLVTLAIGAGVGYWFGYKRR
jgi:hypothetical protein